MYFSAVLTASLFLSSALGAAVGGEEQLQPQRAYA
jgi:hypothetical protein